MHIIAFLTAVAVFCGVASMVFSLVGVFNCTIEMSLKKGISMLVIGFLSLWACIEASMSVEQRLKAQAAVENSQQQQE